MTGNVAIPRDFSLISFNIKVGGIDKARDRVSIDAIATILGMGDIAAVQEVTHRTFARALGARLKDFGDYRTAYFELPENDDKEEGLFVYDEKVASLLDHVIYPDKGNYFRRKPVTALFGIAHKKVGVMSYHAEFGRGNKREIQKLPVAVEHARDRFGIENIIIAADTNLGSEVRGFKDPYFSRYGMRWPQAFPEPGVDTTNSREPATYDYIIWDGWQLVPTSADVITFNEGSQWLSDIMDKTGAAWLLPEVRNSFRRKVTQVSDHWALKMDFALRGDHSMDEILSMPLYRMAPSYVMRSLRRLGAKGYDFPDKRTR